MCGLAGLYSLGQSNSTTSNDVKAMLNVARHRGPDDQGVFSSENGKCSFGLNRLSIIDLETGSQPIFNEDKSIVSVCNGEIYNHKILRDELISKGHRFKTNSDVEVVLHLFEEEGVEGFDKLDGMFAFAIYNLQNGELILGRDRFGIKPHFYSQWDGKLLFASEPKSILELSNDRKVDNGVLYEYLTWGYPRSGKSIWAELTQINPGSVLKVQSSNLEEIKFVKDRIPKSFPSKEAAMEALRESIIDSIRMQLMSDVPLGVFLSGGIDSTIIVGVASKLLNTPLKTFSIDFEKAKYSEASKIDHVANQFKTDHQTFLAGKNVFKFLDDLILAFDEPFGDPAALPTIYLAKETVKHVTVALSGDGSDEFMYGYGHHTESRSTLNRLVRSSIFHELAKTIVPKNKYYYSLVSRTAPIRPWPSNIYDLIRKDLFVFSKQMFEANFKSLEEYERSSYLQNDILFKTDRTTMYHSLEARVPFLGNEVVNTTLDIAKSYQVQNGMGKMLLKEAFEDVLSPEILDQKKHGFTTPVGDWVKESFEKNEFLKLINEAKFAKLLHMNMINRLIHEHFDGDVNHGKFVYRLLLLSKWERLCKPQYTS